MQVQPHHKLNQKRKLMNSDISNLSVIEFAWHIKKRYSMYFAKDVKLTLLFNLLWGFNLNSQKESAVPFQYFNYWAKKKLDKLGPAYDWMTAILESCNNNDEKAFWKFYELLDEFTALKPKSLLTSELTTESFAFYYSIQNKNKQYRIIGEDNRYVLDPAPYHIKLFEFDYCIHSYHFDFYWLVEEYDKNIYYGHFDDLEKCKEMYKDRFNVNDWRVVSEAEIKNEFAKTISVSRNRRKNII
jgi:hypothetical protein